MRLKRCISFLLVLTLLLSLAPMSFGSSDLDNSKIGPTTETKGTSGGGWTGASLDSDQYTAMRFTLYFFEGADIDYSDNILTDTPYKQKLIDSSLNDTDYACIIKCLHRVL